MTELFRRLKEAASDPAYQEAERLWEQTAAALRAYQAAVDASQPVWTYTTDSTARERPRTR